MKNQTENNRRTEQRLGLAGLHNKEQGLGDKAFNKG